MTKKVFNMEGGLHSAAAYSAFENRAYGSCVASTDSFVVTAGTGMNARISAGDGLIDTGLNFARRIQSDAQETVSVEPASTSYNRIDSVVAYIDTAVTPTTSVVDNTNGILKFASVAGTAASSPQAPNQAAIQSAIGAGNPYMVLFNITVPTNAPNLSGATFADQRNLFNVVKASQIPNGFIKSSMVGNKEVKKPAVDFDSGIWWEEIARGTLTSASTTLTVPVVPKKFMKILATSIGGVNGATNGLIMNNDTSATYSRLHFEIKPNGEIVSTTSNSGAIVNMPGSIIGDAILFDVTVVRSAGNQWTFSCNMSGDSFKSGRSGKTAATLSSFGLISSMTNGLAAGTTLVVLGHD